MIVTTLSEKKKQYSFSDPRAKKAWNFIWLNLLAVGAMLGIFYAVLYGDFLTGVFVSAWEWLAARPLLMALCASLPFFAALLVGRASSAKAKRKRRLEAERRAREEIEEARRRRKERRARTG